MRELRAAFSASRPDRGDGLGGLADLTDDELAGLLERICQRSLDHSPFPYLHVDVTREHSDGRWHDVVTATGVRPDIGFEPLAIAVDDSGNEHFWRRFVCGLLLRGLHGVHVVASPEHPFLIRAVREFLPGARWQPGAPLELVPVEDIAVMVCLAEDRAWHGAGPRRGRAPDQCIAGREGPDGPRDAPTKESKPPASKTTFPQHRSGGEA